MLALEATPIGTFKDVMDDKYTLSKDGILVHKKTRKVVKGFKNKGGYLRDYFRVNGKAITKARHRLVWETFIGEIPEGYEINHISEDKTDNRLCNLNLLSHRDNCNWGTRNKRVAKARINHKLMSKSVVQKTLQGEVVAIWPSTHEIQRTLGYSQGNISACCNGIKYRNTAYGYIWEYED